MNRNFSDLLLVGIDVYLYQDVASCPAEEAYRRDQNATSGYQTNRVCRMKSMSGVVYRNYLSSAAYQTESAPSSHCVASWHRSRELSP
ncbi:Major facilitator-type transporter hxnP [Fusarium oxysporum f. sp. albedinis]|nr:Major facilitator-type transporter hxnP [Fusarium oxysporum f. sp. albedinis]